MSESDLLKIDELAAAVTGHAGDRILVGIDGPGASGKSTLAELLSGLLGCAAVVHVDDFYLPSAVRDSRSGAAGALFDLPRLAEQVVLPAAAGQAVRYQRYDWDSDSLADRIEVPAHVPIIVEGVYCLQRELRDNYTYTVFCRADRAVRLRRGLDRDGEQARSSWEDEWMPAEDSYTAEEAPDALADLVLDSSGGVTGGEVRFVVTTWRRR
jgi:uridine kinase